MGDGLPGDWEYGRELQVASLLDEYKVWIWVEFQIKMHTGFKLLSSKVLLKLLKIYNDKKL